MTSPPLCVPNNAEGLTEALTSHHVSPEGFRHLCNHRFCTKPGCRSRFNNPWPRRFRAAGSAIVYAIKTPPLGFLLDDKYWGIKSLSQRAQEFVDAHEGNATRLIGPPLAPEDDIELPDFFLDGSWMTTDLADWPMESVEPPPPPPPPRRVIRRRPYPHFNAVQRNPHLVFPDSVEFTANQPRQLIRGIFCPSAAPMPDVRDLFTCQECFEEGKLTFILGNGLRMGEAPTPGFGCRRHSLLDIPEALTHSAENCRACRKAFYGVYSSDEDKCVPPAAYNKNPDMIRYARERFYARGELVTEEANTRKAFEKHALTELRLACEATQAELKADLQLMEKLAQPTVQPAALDLGGLNMETLTLSDGAPLDPSTLRRAMNAFANRASTSARLHTPLELDVVIDESARAIARTVQGLSYADACVYVKQASITVSDARDQYTAECFTAAQRAEMRKIELDKTGKGLLTLYRAFAGTTYGRSLWFHKRVKWAARMAWQTYTGPCFDQSAC